MELSQKAIDNLLYKYAEEHGIPIDDLLKTISPTGELIITGGKKEHREFIAKVLDKIDPLSEE